MKNYIIVSVLIFLFNGCIKENEDPIKCIENGVIVCQKPLWNVPFDDLPTAICPFPQFDDKIIVGTYKDEKFGLRCMGFETGNIVWEHYFDITGEYLIIQDTYFNYEQGFLIVKIGSWGGKEHIKLDIYTGEILWKSPIESFSGMEAYSDHYYCTVRSSGDVHPIYKVDVTTGHAEFFYETDLPPHPDFNAQRSNWACPFEYNSKEYLFVGESRRTGDTNMAYFFEYFFSVMDANSKERIVKHVPIESPIEKVIVYDGLIYVFTGNGYKIFNMETLSFEKEVKLLARGEYKYHIFYNDKLILGLDYYGIGGIDDNGQSHTHFIIDVDTHTKQFGFDGFNVFPASVMDDILYFVSSDEYYAYDINTGTCVLQFEPSGWETSFCTATYKNSKGEKFVILGDTRHTYCYEGI